MQRDEKDRLEFLFGIKFLTLLDSALSSKAENSESPDILINSGDIGMEITQIGNVMSNNTPRMQLEGSWDSLIEKLQSTWNHQNMPGCHISLSFNQRRHIPKSESKKVAFEILNFIKHFVPEDGHSYVSTDDIHITPRYLHAFSIERLVKYDKGIFNYGDGIFSPKLERQKVQKAIDKKEFLRLDYLKKCKEIWLLIVLYGGRASGDFIIEDKVTQHDFEFRFDKVFLFDALPKKFWELNKSSNFT
jgi:hypothetical protein